MKKARFFFIIFLLSLSFFKFAHAQRDSIAINNNWLFRIDPTGVGFSEHWFLHKLELPKVVSIPHTWNVEKGTNQYYGWAWYQKKILIKESWKTKKIILQFAAVNHTAKFYINGKLIGENIGDGFNQFQIKLDSGIVYGKQNLLTVAVDNSFNKRKIPFGSSFDWPNDGGIIRKVRLQVTNSQASAYVHVTPQLNLQDSSGRITIKLGQDSRGFQNLQLHATITEENQPSSHTIYQKKIQISKLENEWVADLFLPKVHPWHFDSPNLYRVTITIRDGKKMIDKLSAVCGFRSFKFEQGAAILNGEKIKMIGVEWTAGSNPNFGFAEPDSVILRYARLMKDVNCIFTRQHFQQDELFYDFCDRNGVLVQQELPLWGPETPGRDSIKILAHTQLKTMIQHLFNHCSIISWGVGNELRGRDPDIKNLVTGLLNQVHQLDPTRLATYVSNTLNDSYINHPNFTPDVSAQGDYIAMNEYGGSWWKVPLDKIPAYLDSIHLSYPDKPLIISEFGLCEPNFSGGDERRVVDLKNHLAIYQSKPYIAAAIYFDLTDYRTHYPGTFENDKFRRRIHGVYDMFGVEKPSKKVLQELSSPIAMADRIYKENGKMQISIEGKNGIPQYTATGYQLFISENETNYLLGASFRLPTIAPGKKVKVDLPQSLAGKKLWFSIVRPNGYLVIQKYLELE